MELLLFYGILLFLLIYTLFFTEKGWAPRNFIIYSSILLLIVTPQKIVIGNFFITGYGVFILLLFFWRITTLTNLQLFTVIAGICITCLCLMSIYLFIFVQPILLILSEPAIQALIIFFILRSLIPEKLDLFIAACTGIFIAHNMINIILPTTKNIYINNNYTIYNIIALIFLITFIRFRNNASLY